MPPRLLRFVFLVGVLALSLASAGCTTREWVPVRYAAPVGEDHAADLDTNRCAHTCHRNAGDDSARFYRCLATCPGIVRDQAATCEDPAPGPERFCYTQWIAHEVEERRAATAPDVIAGFFGQLLGGILKAALTPKRHHREQARHFTPPQEPDDRGVRSEPNERPRPSRRRDEDDGPRHYTPAERRRR